MNYYNELTRILDKLSDVRTVSGLQVDLRENIPTPYPITYVNINDKVQFVVRSNALIFFEADVIDYENEIAVFIFKLTAELSDNFIAGKLPGNNIAALYEKLDQYRDAMVDRHSHNINMDLFTEMFEKFQAAGFISKEINPADRYELCLDVRLLIRRQIILKLKDQIISLEESIISNAKAGSEIISDGPVTESCVWKLAWLKDIGLIDAILWKCGKTKTSQPNWSQAAKVISEFTGEKASTIVPCLRHMGTFDKNDPLKNETRDLDIQKRILEIFLNKPLSN